MGKSIPFRVVATLFVGGEVGCDTELGLKGEIPVFLSSTFCVGCAEINASYSSGGGGKLPWLTLVCLAIRLAYQICSYVLENPF